jgi:hypothetical protein
LLAAALTDHANAQAGRFSDRVKATPAAEVQPTIDRASEVVRDTNVLRDTNVVVPPAPAAIDDAPAPADDVRARAAVIVAPQIVRRLDRGQTLYVRELPSDVEQQAKDIVEQQVADAEPQEATVEATVQSFEGIVRQRPMDPVDDDDELQLKPYVLVGQPLQYQKNIARFVGTIHVGVADLSSEGRSRVLASPLDFQVLETAVAEPERFVISATSPPYQRVAITSEVTGAIARLRVASNFDLAGMVVEVPVEPTLLVSIDGDDLRAFGIQTARVTVTAVGGTAAPRGSPILSVSGEASAFLEDDAPMFDAAGRARTTLRTDGVGEVVVKAEYPSYAPGEDGATVIWPLFTLGAASLGGLVGGVLRLAPRVPNRISALKLAIGLVTAVLLGVVVFALYVVGVKVLPVDFGVQTGDIFAFACAALAGWLGTGVLPQLPAKEPAA